MKISDLPEKQSLACNSPAKSATSSSTETDTILEFSTFIEKLRPILDEMKGSEKLAELPTVRKAIESLETDFEHAKSVIGSQNIQSQNIRSSPAKHIEDLAQNLGRSLGLVLFASHDVPIANKEKIKALRREMMNTRFEFNSEFPSEAEEEIIEAETEIIEAETETEDEIIEVEEERRVEDRITLDIDDVIVNVKNGNDEEFKKALLGLNELIIEGMISNERINNEGLISVLAQRLGSCKGSDRVTIIQILRYLISQHNQTKEEMKDLGFLSALVKSLARDEDEQREAVGLLMNLADDLTVRRRIGRIRGCIVMLVTISNNGDDQQASRDAKKLLDAISSNTQNALHMAEAGYFKPLIHYLKEGSDMSKVVMATAISRMELTDQNKASLGKEGAIEPLVKMFNHGNLEAKLSALNALQTLSTLKENIQLLIHLGIATSLLQLLFSVTSVQMTLREPASAILAKISQSQSALIKQDIAQQMLSLLNLSSPIIQNHLLEALNNIASHSSASRVRKKMKENGAIQLLLPFFNETNTKIRTGALKLVYTLSKDIPGELREQLGDMYLTIITNIVSTSTHEGEKEAALGILSNLPVNDKKITELLKNANLLPVLISMASSTSATSCTESIARILIRFTIQSDKKLQQYSVDNGIIPVLVKLLSSGSSVTISMAASSLSQLSQNSLYLSKSRKSKWFCIPSTEAVCEVHDGYCSTKSTFCLVKAGVVSPLIRVLEGSERASDEAVLGCLSTLLQDEIWENGVNYISKKLGIQPILKVVELGNLKAQEKALWVLERVLRVEGHRVEYGESAQVLLIDLAQNGDPVLKPIVAKLLAQLELLQSQSSYF